MKKIEQIIDKLGITGSLRKLILQEIQIPILDDYNPVNKYWYPHPPCLIPLFLGYGASYKGMIHHFFCDRKNTFIEYYLENGYISEIARNKEQLFTLLILKMITIKESLSDEIIDFCNKINYTKMNEVDEFSIKYGDNPKDFKNLVYYNENTPFIYVKDINDYDGDFPSSLTILNHKQINNSCEFEISNKELLNKIPDIPKWLRNEQNKKELFQQYISENKLKEAWLTLNSKGWLLKDVAESLEALKVKSNDTLLQLVADNWIDKWKQFGPTEMVKY